MGRLQENDFNFFVPFDEISKSEEQYPRGDERRYENMIFQGVASDRSEDYEGESMEPNGFQIDYFLKHGLFNLDHLTSRAKELKSRFWIGEPLEAKIQDGKFWVKGRLWKDSPEARAFWDKCIEMKESGSTRRPGMSIEGKALERDPKNPKRILRAIINNIALTFTPVNFNSYLEFAKGIQSQDFYPTDGQMGIDPSRKSVMFEQVVGGKRITIDSGFNIHEEIVK